MESKLIDELLSVMVEYVSRHIVYQAVLFKNNCLRSAANTIHDPPIKSAITISDLPSGHDVAVTAVLDLLTIKHKDSGEDVKSVICIDELLM